MASSRIKKKKGVFITCQYCDHFRKAERFGLNRICKETNKVVNYDTDICDRYKVLEIIFCDKSSYFLDFSVCVNRINKKRKQCTRCKQSKVIKKILKERL